ncbi:MAG: hypothetical protein EOO08_14375 [Chitinophagaceae bacterium]|nr:MAG: hypothetical protein EOO08_14375 [Chitinophagaceae bacterium]
MKLNLLGATLAISVLTLASCSHDSVEAPTTPSTPPATSNNIYYVDSAKIYRVSLSGTDRMLIAGIDTTSPNSFIGSAVRSVDGSKIFFLHYTSGSSQSIKLYSVSSSGTNLQMLKTMQTGGNEYRLLNATADNKILFHQMQVTGGALSYSIQTIGSDGNGQAQVVPFPSGSPLLSRIAPNSRWAGIAFGGTATIKTGTATSASLGTATDVGSPLSSGAYAMSSDGSKIAYAVQNGGSIDVKVYDIAGNSTTTAFSHVIVSDIGTFTNYTTSVRWVNGTEKLLLSYGKFTSPSGSPSDFTQVVLHTMSGGADVAWRIHGDEVTNIIAE